LEAQWSPGRAGTVRLGRPHARFAVLVTANYTLSFDALRSALAGIDGYIMVLDTQGVNVWCAAGKATFGTDELVRRIEATRLHEVVRHPAIILPQLGAPGVAAHEVQKRSGFKVEYGPARAADLPRYLKTGQATPEMRQVRFALRDRLVLVPVEVVHIVLPLSILVALLVTLAGRSAGDFEVAAAIVAGVVLFPLLLPWLPTRDFSSKGFILGGLVALPFILGKSLNNPDLVWWRQAGGVLATLLTVPPCVAYMTLNFTGSTTFTSRSEVRREIFTYIPVMAGMVAMGVLLSIILWLV